MLPIIDRIPTSPDDRYALSDGNSIPCIGYGTWRVKDREDGARVCEEAVRAGYRHFDTAYLYGSEGSVGEAVRTSGLARSDFFVTTKVLEKGFYCTFVTSAIGTEQTSKESSGEFRRKVRIGRANFNFLFSYLPLLNPFRPMLAYLFFSHKILRWFSPHILILLFVAIVYHMLKNTTVTCVAGVVLEGILCAVFVLKKPLLEGAFQKLLSVFYLNGRLANFFDGMLDIGGIVYFLSIIAVFLVLTEQTIVKRRWS